MIRVSVVGFVADKEALEQAVFQYFSNTLSVTFRQHSTVIIY
jgi:hypothetical protein